MNDKTINIRNGTLHMTLIKLHKTHRRRVAEEFSRIGITQGQPKILDFLIENDGCIQRELAENCNIEPATVTSILANMEKAELIYRTQNPSDRRILNVYLTDKGRCAQKEVEKVFSLVDEECFKGFSEIERIETINYLMRLQRNISKEGKR